MYQSNNPFFAVWFQSLTQMNVNNWSHFVKKKCQNAAHNIKLPVVSALTHKHKPSASRVLRLLAQYYYKRLQFVLMGILVLDFLRDPQNRAPDFDLEHRYRMPALPNETPFAQPEKCHTGVSHKNSTNAVFSCYQNTILLFPSLSLLFS